MSPFSGRSRFDATVMRLFTFAALLATVSCATLQSPPRSHSKPNFLVIVVDDMGMADLGAFGGEIETPNLDRLAMSGIRLTNFHTSPVCSATRAMLLTGVDNHKAGLGNMAEELAPNQMGQPGHDGELNDRVVTIATLLRDNGYRTYMTGKWHLGMSEEASPYSRGFDRSFTLLAGGASHFADMLPAYNADPKAKAPYRRDREMVDRLPANFNYSSQFYVDQMIDYFREDAKSQKPFFAYLAFTAPHWPLQAPEETIAKYRGAYDMGFDEIRMRRLQRQKVLGVIPQSTTGNERPPKGEEWASLSEPRRRTEARSMEVYAAMIDEIDKNVGRLIDELEQSRTLDNTVVIFISDNGAEGHDLDETWPSALFPEIRRNIDDRHDYSFENMGRPNSYVFYGPNWARAGGPAFRLHKGFPTEGGTRVPAFVHYREFLKSKVSDRFFSVKDIAPTVLELAGVQHPAFGENENGVEAPTGASMRKALIDPQMLSAVDERVDAGEIMGKYMVRKGQWKIVHMPPPHGSGGWQLYDLEDDLAETNDLSSTRPEIISALIAEWNEYAAENGVILPDWVSGY